MEIWRNGGNGVVWALGARGRTGGGPGQPRTGQIWSARGHWGLSRTAIHLFWVPVILDFIQKDCTGNAAKTPDELRLQSFMSIWIDERQLTCTKQGTRG